MCRHCCSFRKSSIPPTQLKGKEKAMQVQDGIKEQVIQILAESTNIDPDIITPEMPLSGPPMNINWGVVSERVLIMLYLEDRFGLESIPSDTEESWQTVADIVAYIEGVSQS